MADVYSIPTTSRNQNRRPLPTNYEDNRYTPMPDENFSEIVNNDQPFRSPHPPSNGGRPEFYHLKANENNPVQSSASAMDDPYPPSRTGGAGAELYHLKRGENDPEPMRNDQPFQSTSPPLDDPYPPSRATGSGPEFYYLNGDKARPDSMRDDQPYKSTSPPLNNSYPPSRTDGAGPELYHVKLSGENQPNQDYRPPSEFHNHNRVSPMPHQDPSSTQPGAEMYYLQGGNESPRQTPSMKKTAFNDQPAYLDNQDPNTDADDQPGRTTVYVLSAPDGENRPPPFSTQQRTPSPPIHPTKKQAPPPAVSYNLMDDDSPKKHDAPTKRRPFPTALNDVSTNIRYVPLSQSKASESIQRSMNKYRFGGS